MENATDALKMAAAVLIFVMALSISINAFGEVRKASQSIIDLRDREYNYTYVEENGTTDRIVGIESIIPTIYKASIENYKIQFVLKTGELGIEGDTEGIYKKVNTDGTIQEIYTIDLTDEGGITTNREEFLMAILYGENYQDFENFKINNIKIRLNSVGLYDKIKEKKFKESIGLYYLEETEGASDIPSANKTTKRVITYTEV